MDERIGGDRDEGKSDERNARMEGGGYTTILYADNKREGVMDNDTWQQQYCLLLPSFIPRPSIKQTEGLVFSVTFLVISAGTYCVKM